ncbi:MAG TPA: hypothetical protein VMV16_04670 [Solirubrobacteraceae bacterium]|nr:hypothetical protein [Solirubrobacteraceae bacterium]
MMVARDLPTGRARITGMRKLVVVFAIVGGVILAWSGVALGERAAGHLNVPGQLSIRTPAGTSDGRVEFAEPAGVILLFRVVAPVGTRAKVTGVIPGLAGVTIPIPLARSDNAETCARQGGAVVCTQAEEACPMPAASWRFRVRKLGGPAGRIRIDFLVGRAASWRSRETVSSSNVTSW